MMDDVDRAEATLRECRSAVIYLSTIVLKLCELPGGGWPSAMRELRDEIAGVRGAVKALGKL
jgi:hypothetical protein